MKLLTTIVFAAVLMACNFSSAHEYKLGALQIGHPWSRATPKGTSVGGGYLKVTNTGTTSDRLIGGSTPIANRVEVHEMSMDNGVMRMRPLRDGLEIKPGQTVEFTPGSYHIMFVGLKQPIKEDDHVKGTLTFEKAGSIDVEYIAVGVGGTPGKGASKPDEDVHGMSGMSH